MPSLKVKIFVATLVAGAVALQIARAVGAPDMVVVLNGAVPPIATVNGKPIDSVVAALMARDLSAAGKPANGVGDKSLAEQLVTKELLVQEAMKAGLDKNPDVLARDRMLHQDVLANAYIKSYLVAHPISDTQVRAEYDRRKVLLNGAKEYKLRHIVVAEKNVAGDVIKQLGGGHDFEQVADDFSIDTGTPKSYGGSLGWVSIDNSDRRLIEAAAKLKTGEYSHEAVTTRSGWQVLKLDGVRDIRIQPYEAVKNRLHLEMQQQEAQNVTQELRAKATVVWKEGTAPPSAAM